MSIDYTYKMDITDWNNDEIMRLITAKGHITQKVLLNKIKHILNQDVPQSTFASKIRRNGLKLSEFQVICNLLGYKINIERTTSVHTL